MLCLIAVALLALSTSAVTLLDSTNRPNCYSLQVPLQVTSNNVNITLPEPQTTGDLIAITEQTIALNGAANLTEAYTSGMRNISGNYTINTKLCVPLPEDRKSGRDATVQFLIHGVSFDMSYWDFPLFPSNYSYVEAANRAGFTTFAIDRLGAGESSKPDDPINRVQVSSEVEIVRLLTTKLRDGSLGLPNISRFEKVIHVGHSFGSVLSNGLVAATPNVSDGLVLTGYSHNASGMAPFLAALMLDRAQNVDPIRFGSLPNGYVIPSPSVYGNEIAFYQVGEVNENVVSYAIANAQTATLGELLTTGIGVVPAPSFRGPVLTITGQNDLPFCAGACFGENYPYIIGQEAQFWPASSNFTAHSPLDTGHVLNLHFSAPSTYAFINAWLSSNGF